MKKAIQNRHLKKGASLLLTGAMILSAAPVSLAAQTPGLLSHLGSYSTGYSDQDGGVAEIVSYNKDNQKFYLVNGKEQTLDIVSIADIKHDAANQEMTLDIRVNVGKMSEEKIPGFAFGDITSIAIDTEHNRIAAAIQEADYSKNGALLIMDYDGNYVEHFTAGVQPDNVVFSVDGTYLLSANEGEPRMGYEKGTDPKGSVTIVDFSGKRPETKTVTFDAWDDRREELLENHVLLKKGLNPSTDFEPEYIAVASDGKAYVSLQEANAIAAIDLEKGTFVSINSLGFKDHSEKGNEIDVVKDKEVNIKSENLMGTYMPDGISIYETGTSTYLLTANEGDASEWEEYENLTTIKINGEEVEVLDPEKVEGFPKVSDGTSFILGGRSFSIYQVTDEGLKQVFDSGSDFETITAGKYEDYFNASNKNNKKDSRSDAKGPEPESVATAKIGSKTYAYIGLERIGGIMVYDITDPANSVFCDYINTRNFEVEFPDEGTAPEQGDISVEGICAVAACDSPTHYPMILAANEVSGTVAVYGINEGQDETDDVSGDWSFVNGQWSFRRTGGSNVTGDWAKIDGHWYHFNADGIMETGWISLNNTWYYLHKDGSMAYNNWLFLNDEWYYVNQDGSMKCSEWIWSDGHWYYFGSNGNMLKNTTTPDGYVVNADGCRIN